MVDGVLVLYCFTYITGYDLPSGGYLPIPAGVTNC
jgi:hypothetical protein